MPHWLLHACVSRNWIFVTPDYRLIPEKTAHSAVQDAADAYEWTRTKLPSLLDRPLSSVLLAGSSAGGYLALTTAASVVEKPAALLLVYGMLDPTGSWYASSQSHLFGQPLPDDVRPILDEYPKSQGSADDRKAISVFPATNNPQFGQRFGLVHALHKDALFPDYLTGMSGLTREIAAKGAEAIPEEHARLFPLSSCNLSTLPRTMLLHGINDSAVPIDASRTAEEKLRTAGVEVLTGFPEDGEHGFDVQLGNVDVEKATHGSIVPTVETLKRVIDFLQSSVAK